MKAKASKALPKKMSRKSGALAEAIKRLPKTVPVAKAQPDNGIIEIEAAMTFARHIEVIQNSSQDAPKDVRLPRCLFSALVRVFKLPLSVVSFEIIDEVRSLSLGFAIFLG